MTKANEKAAVVDEERPSPPPRKDRGPDGVEEMSARSVVKSFHENPKGDVDGLTLADGKEVRFPPHLGKKIAEMVAKGDEVEIAGRKHTGPKGDIHLRAETIKNVKSGESIEVGPPHEKGSPPHEKGSPPHEQMLTEIRAIRALIEGNSKEVQQVSDKKPSGPPHEQVLMELRDLRKFLESHPVSQK